MPIINHKIYPINKLDGSLFLKKVKKKDINDELHINVGYAGTWRPGPFNTGSSGTYSNGWQGDALNYVIYEKDGWPTTLQSTSIINFGWAPPDYHYRSADPYYDQGIIVYYLNGSVDMGHYSRDITGQIKFNSRL